MSNYNDLVEFRNKIVNDTDYVLLEEDCQLLDRILDDYEQKDQRIAELEKQLAEKDKLLGNAIVPKFKVGDEVWVIKRIKQEIANGKIIKKYSYFNGGTPENLRNVNRWRIRLKNKSEVTKKEYELFVTREQAEEYLKKMERK
jgi:hypothetical protein